jgi:hypothetical protein
MVIGLTWRWPVTSLLLASKVTEECTGEGSALIVGA